MALVIALAVTVVFSMTVVTVIESATSNQRNSTMSNGPISAYNLAEAGLSNAMSVLRVPTNNALDKYVFCTDTSTLPTLPCKRTETYSGGKVTWYGTLYQNAAAGTAYWDLFSTGYVRNPHGRTDYQNTIRATIPVVPTTTQPLNNPSWNYIFARATGTGQALQRLRHDDPAERGGPFTSLRDGQPLPAEQGEDHDGPSDRERVHGSPAELQTRSEPRGPISARLTSGSDVAIRARHSTIPASTARAARHRRATTSGPRSWIRHHPLSRRRPCSGTTGT